ncbi:hypothetical protein LB506_009797 [Fusarium annulatum]|nr:hypothetical protein LB506_009797 [Fusarium annulatum]
MWFMLRSIAQQGTHNTGEKGCGCNYVEIRVDEDRSTGHNKGRIRAASSGDPWSRYLSSGPVALLGLG